jgi:hypothetical protein
MEEKGMWKLYRQVSIIENFDYFNHGEQIFINSGKTSRNALGAIFNIYMLKTLILFLAFFTSTVTYAQLAVIRDNDGFSNIRQEPNNDSEIIDTISNDRLVFCFEEEAKGNWLPVDYNKDGKTQSGYIHKSRVVYLDSLDKFQVATINDSILTLQYKSLQVTMRIGKFNTKGRTIKYEKPESEQQYVKSIDGKFPWGTDGNIPRKEYKFIQLKSGKKLLTAKKTFYSNLFEPNLDMTTAYINKLTNTLFIAAMNSDGAGGYVVVWIIKDELVINREIFRPF